MFRRLLNLFRRWFGWFAPGLERPGAEALLNIEKENLRKQIASYNQGLAAHAGLCERLISQIQRQEGEERDLAAQAMANLRLGNQDVAGQYALRLQTLRRELAENRTQAAAAEQTYQELIRTRDVAVKSARAKLEALASAMDDLKSQKAAAELTEMASGMVGPVGSSGDTLRRLHELVAEERAQAVGRARVARDILEMYDPAAAEASQPPSAEAALAEFATQAGITLESATPDPARPRRREATGPTTSAIQS